jgi:hypothetical protein
LTLALGIALVWGAAADGRAAGAPPAPAGSEDIAAAGSEDIAAAGSEDIAAAGSEDIAAAGSEDIAANPGAEPPPARRVARGDEPRTRSARDRSDRLPLSLRVGIWPLWTAATKEDPHPVPPFVELSFGYKVRWFELGVHAGVALGEPFDIPGTVLGLGLSASFYSLRLDSFRLRHGIAVGVLSDLLIRRRPPPVKTLPMPTARLSALDLFVRLGEGWWLEIAPLSFGWPAFYELALGIRYEIPVD